MLGMRPGQCNATVLEKSVSVCGQVHIFELESAQWNSVSKAIGLITVGSHVFIHTQSFLFTGLLFQILLQVGLVFIESL